MEDKRESTSPALEEGRIARLFGASAGRTP
jgi:hypothetical protein